MNWKSWPYWVRGTLLFSAIFLPLFFIDENTQWIFLPIGLVWLLLGEPYILSVVYFLANGESVLNGNAQNRGIVIVLTFLVYIVLGSLLGHLYGKFKNRRKVI